MEQNGKYKLTNQQSNIYLLDSMYKDTGINNIISWLEIDEQLDCNIMEKVANIIVQKNDGYRLRFNLEDANPYQYVQEYKRFKVELIEVETIYELEKILKQVKIDLKKDLPFKCYNFKYPNGKGGFCVVAHHLISDAWTMSQLVLQIVNYYYNIKNDIEIDDKKEPSYIEYVLSQQEFMQSDRRKKNQEYWESIFEKPVDILTFKDKPNVGINSKRKEYMLDKDVIDSVRKFCEHNNISEYVFMLSVYSIYFGRIKNTNRYVIGNPILNRANAKEKAMAGLFMSTNPFVIEIDENSSFVSFAKKIQQEQMNMYRHLKYDYKELTKYINEKNNNYGNIYDVVFSYQNAKVDKQKNNLKTRSRWVENNRQIESLMVHLKDTDDTGNILFAYDYLVDVFTTNDIEQMHRRIEYIISQVLDNIFIKYIDIVPKEEKQQLLFEYNDTYYEYNRSDTIVSCFERMCQKQFNKTALVFENEKISYGELNKRANQLARALKNIGVQNGDIVAVVDSRSIEMFFSMLAILKLGASYVPIDIEYPKDRIEYIIKNADCSVCITKEKYKDRFYTSGKRIFSDDKMIYNLLGENLYEYIPSSNLAYMIYTSGSTGNPKGVMITHHNVINFIKGTTNIIDFNNKTIVSVTTISFDIFVLESWLALAMGCTILIANEDQQNIAVHLNKLCLENNVDMIQTTPSRMKLLMLDSDNNQFLSNMSTIMLGGESVPYQVVQDLRKITNAKIYNMYGPTETTVWSSIKDITNDDKITIGNPIANTQIYIFDNNMNLCPEDVVGNIYIGGEGLSAGYYNNLDLTNEKFIQNPYIKGQYIYNTGDIGKWNKNISLECLGRSDFQVKLHGHRIELEEIENTILNFENIQEASAICINNDAIYAYFTAKVNVLTKDLRKYVQQKLPAYMVPAKFIQIDNMPKTPNGKTDKKSLIKLDVSVDEEILKEANEPKTDIEKDVCNLVSQILEIECNDVDADVLALGMDSLNIIDLCNRIIKQYNVNVTVKDIFELKNIYAISQYIQNAIGQSEYVASEEKDMRNESNNICKATIAQERIYFASKLTDNNIVYNMPYAMYINGKVDIQRLNESVKKVIDRHSALRINFEVYNGQLYQKVNDIVKFDIEVENIEEVDIDKKCREYIKPFDFSVAPLMRMKLLRISHMQSVLLFDMHHIISDGTSLQVLANDISRLYNGEGLNKLKIQYINYANYLSDMLNSDKLDGQKKYWINKLNEIDKTLNMPYDYNNANNNDFKGRKTTRKLGNEIYRNVNKYAMSKGVTPNMVLLATYYLVLKKYTKKNNVTVGLPIANRTIEELADTIGLYANELPMQINFDNLKTIDELLNAIKKQMLDIVDNSTIPNGEIVRLLKENNIVKDNKLFDTMFVFQNNGMPKLELNGVKTIPYLFDTHISKYNFSLEIINQKEQKEYELNLEYSTSLFKNTTMERFLAHYINMLDNVISNVNLLIDDFDIIDNEEKTLLLYEFNNTKCEYDKNLTIHKMIANKAKQVPNDIALVFENEKMTYAKLDELTDKLACTLRQKGIKRNDVIGIMLPRCLEMLIGIIAILKCGATYMPIDVTYPKDRIEYMIKNSCAKTILVTDKVKTEFKNVIDITLNRSNVYNVEGNVNIGNINEPEDGAYLIYTSGSTGRPKGVLVKHKGITNLVNYCNENVEFLKGGKKRNIISVTTMSFDIFVFETLIALQKGLTVVIANEDEQRIPSKLNDVIQKNDVQIIQMTPSRMQMLIEYIQDIPCLRELKYIVLAGEQYKDSLFEQMKKINPNVISYNGYGPSETTIFSTLTLVNGKEKINIGKPVYNTQIYILDEQKRLVPMGQVGEIYIGGDGVSKGYINNVPLTNERFIQNPYIKSDIIYQTGDLGRWLENGELECIGRADSQVKIRGLRIELEEIENAILKSGLVNQVIVVEKLDLQNRQYLSAYFTANKEVEIKQIRDVLVKALPVYMIPTHIEQLVKFEYTPNGKIDKKILKQRQDILKENYEHVILPKTKLQTQLLEIYKKILNVNNTSIDSSFFEIGGDSMLAMKLQIELINRGFDITYADIFKYPSIEQLENRINLKVGENIEKIEVNNYDTILNNTMKNIKMQKQDVKSVLLTGATGFVGIHILADLLENNIQKVYCLVRQKDGKTSIERLKDKLHFYFSTKYDKYIGNRIIVIDSDIENAYENIERYIANMDAVINASAKVSHYGDETEFEKINVNGVQKLVDICKKYNKKLFHLSTMSVSGNALVDQTFVKNNIEGQVDFTEKDFYINQPLDNVYIKTKFMAEQIILDNILTGLDAYILRLGNIMGRYSDGRFQDNANDNSYINRLKAIYTLGVIPEYIKDGYLEFTPVDCLAKAINKIVFNNNNLNRIFHLFNDKHITIINFINICNKLYKKIEIVSEQEFKKQLDKLLKENNYIGSYILNDMDDTNKLQYVSNIKVRAEFTNKYLSNLGFDWPNIDETYIKKFLDYLFEIKFFRKE